MENDNANNSMFYVVQFLEFPLEGVSNYVCVPHGWVIFRTATDQRGIVAYPNNECPTKTRERAKRMERYDDEWRFYSVKIKHETNSYEDAENWITARSDNEPSSKNGAQPIPPVDRESRISNHSYSSESKEDKSELSDETPRKQLVKVTIKRPALEELKQQLNTKRTKLMSVPAAGAKCGLIPNANAEPGSSRTDQSTTGNKQLRPAEHITIVEKEHHSQRDKQSSETNRNIQDHPTNNITSASMTVPKPPITVEQTPQPKQHSNQKHPQDSENLSSNFELQITDVRTLATISNNQERADDVSDNGPPDSLSIESRLSNQTKGIPSLVPVVKKLRLENITRNVKEKCQAKTSRDHSVLMDETELPEPVTRLQSQSLRDMPVASQEIQHVARITIERSHNVTAVDPRVVPQSINDVAKASRNPSSTPQQRPSFICLANGQRNLPAPQQHTQQATQGQDSSQRSVRSLNVDQSKASHRQANRPDAPTGMPWRFSGGVGGLELDLPYQAQLMMNQQQSRHPPRDPRAAAVQSMPTVERPSPSGRGVLRRAPPAVLLEVPNSISEALFASGNNYLSDERQRQALINECSKQLSIAGLDNVVRSLTAGQPSDMIGPEMPPGSSHRQPGRGPSSVHENVSRIQRVQSHPVNQSHARSSTTNQVLTYSSRGVDSSRRKDVCMVAGSPSPCDGMNPDSGFDTDQERATGLTDKPLGTNEVGQSEHGSVGRSTAAQNASSRSASEQQMLDQFTTILTEMSSSMHNMANFVNHLRDSINEKAKTCHMMLGIIEKFKTTSHPCSCSIARRDVPPVAEETPAARVEGANRPDGDRPSNAANEAPEINPNNRWRFVLPPEYDPEDTKWTLKYRELTDGLCELLPGSGVYVRRAKLRSIKEMSNNCRSLAQRLLVEIFNRSALSVCSSIKEKSEIGYKTRPDARPDLDEHGCLVLINFVVECGLERGWNTDIRGIIQGLHAKVKELRCKFGIRAKC